MTDAKKIVRLLFEEPWKGNMDVIDEYLAPGYIGHDPSEPEPIRGPEGFRGQIEKYLAAFPDTRFTIDDQFAEGEHVATRWTARGTHQGEIGGISPTGKEVTRHGTDLLAVRGRQSDRGLDHLGHARHARAARRCSPSRREPDRKNRALTAHLAPDRNSANAEFRSREVTMATAAQSTRASGSLLPGLSSSRTRPFLRCPAARRRTP
jgi:hypothetical protein